MTVRHWRQMVQQTPAATLADGLGAQRGTAAHHARIAGADHTSYPSNTDRSIVEMT